LSQYRVIVLPNVIRMDAEEVVAFRDYVSSGGKLYASADTGLLDAPSGAMVDALADMFGFTRQGVQECTVAFAHPKTTALQQAIAPRRVSAHGNPRQSGAPNLMSVPLVSAHPSTTALASLEFPYGKGLGNKVDREFCSIHASPPFQASDAPAVLRRQFGKGEVIYSALDLERNTPAATDETPDFGALRLFEGLITQLLGDEAPLFRVHGDRGILALAFQDTDKDRIRLHVANYQPHGPFRPAPNVSIEFAAPGGRDVAGVTSLPGNDKLSHTRTEKGAIRIELGDVDLFRIISIQLVGAAR
jgi:hypothetical protein